MLLTGWSLIEGVGTAPIMLAIVALVASNFASDKRSAVYGLVAAAAAMAVARTAVRWRGHHPRVVALRLRGRAGESRLEAAGGRLQPLLRPTLLANKQLSGGLTMFFAQFMVQAGVFFSVPLLLFIVLGLDALQTGVRLIPLSIALLVAAVGVPKVWTRANPRRVVRIGLLLMIVGIGFLVAGMDAAADAGVTPIPMVLMGLASVRLPRNWCRHRRRGPAPPHRIHTPQPAAALDKIRREPRGG